MNVMNPAARGDLAQPRSARLAIRRGYTGTTAGMAPGYIQANIVILPAALADDFATFCRANPKSCPLIAMSKPGDPALPDLGADIDMRSDLPGYRVFRDGVMTGETAGVESLWRDDLVTFAIGCSYTFEAALIAGGIPLRHVMQNRSVAMYRTNRETEASGPFGGKLVVSMRPVREADVSKAYEITGRFPDMHGAPVHAGDPLALGIGDIMAPDYGEAVEILPGEVPVFWACGVTSQVAVETARLPFFMAHAPGKMLITDRLYGAA